MAAQELKFETLVSANFTQLEEAITQWKTLPGKFRQIKTNFFDEVESPISNSDWEGDAADAAQDKIGRVSKQIDRAADEAADVHDMLNSAYKSFTTAKSTLVRYKGYAEDDRNLTIDSAGHVSYKPKDVEDLTPQQQTLQAKNYSEIVQGYNRTINETLSAAREADSLLEWVLAQDYNGRSKGFSSDGYNSIKSARKGQEAALKDLETLTKLANSTDKLTDAQLKIANAAFAKHEGDPHFSEKFATRMGPKGTLEFWQKIVDQTQYGDQRTKLTAKLQKSMSFTLATASHSDSPAMKKWKEDMVKLGPERLPDTSIRHEPRLQGPYGFQVMSSLMRHGEYDKDFLFDYGKGVEDPNTKDKDGRTGGLLEFEREYKGKPETLWRADGYQAMLNVSGGSDHGMDPMAGYMEALGHNPEAAQALFYREGYERVSTVTPDPDLKYLLTGREWPNGNPLSGDNRGYGYDELGHALEAATLGHPYDQPEVGLNRTPESANIMTQTVSMVAGDSGLVDGKPGISNSLAKMGAGYIDDLDWAAANFGDSDYGDEARDSAFGRRGEGHIDVRNESAVTFLAEVGGQKGSYEILSAAQQEATIHALKSNPEPNAALTLALETGSQVQGVLDGARADSVIGDGDDSKTEQARKLSEAAEWQKYQRSQGVGAVAGLITLPLEASGADKFLTPFIDAGAAAIDTHSGIMIDREMERQQREFDDKIDGTTKDLRNSFEEAGKRRAQNPLDAYIGAHRDVENDSWHDETARAVKDGYDRGFNDSQ